MWYFALIGAHSFSFEPSIMPRLLLGFLYICIVLKKFAKIILGVFGVIALIVGISSKNSKKRVKELKNDLKDNKKDLDAVRKEKKEVEKNKEEVVKDIAKGLSEIQEAKKTKPVVKKKSVTKAKESLKKRLNG